MHTDPRPASTDHFEATSIDWWERGAFGAVVIRDYSGPSQRYLRLEVLPCGRLVLEVDRHQCTGERVLRAVTWTGRGMSLVLCPDTAAAQGLASHILVQPDGAQLDSLPELRSAAWALQRLTAREIPALAAGVALAGHVAPARVH